MASDPDVWVERWDKSDIAKAVRRGDLMPLTKPIMQKAFADAKALLDDDGLSHSQQVNGLP